MEHQLGDVLGPLAQRRQQQREDVEPIIEVLAESPLADQNLQVLVGGRDDADVDADRVRGADAFEHPLLQHAQQLGLHVERDVADLVEEQRAAVGQLESAHLVAMGAGEGPLDVTEQLALQEAGR